MSQVQFFRGTQAQYDALARKSADALYFLTDTGRLCMGDTCLSYPALPVDDFPAAGESGTLYVRSATGEARLWSGSRWIDIGTDDCTAFELYATDADFDIGDAVPWCGLEVPYLKIPASLTHKFILRSNTPFADSDVIIDWGDGSFSAVSDGEDAAGGFERKSVIAESGAQDEYNYLMSHTYSSAGHYVMRIYGRDYFAVGHELHHPDYAFGLALEDSIRYNLTCAAFSRDSRIAGHLANLSGLYEYSCRIISMNAQMYRFDLANASNIGAMFQCCFNLRTALGMKSLFGAVYAVRGLFNKCYSLAHTDFRIPPVLTKSTGAQLVFNDCRSLSDSVAKLLPDVGFATRRTDLYGLFNNCASLTGTVPASLLWENADAGFANTAICFAGCPGGIRAQVPVSWGGTNTEIEVPLPAATAGQWLTMAQDN